MGKEVRCGRAKIPERANGEHNKPKRKGKKKRDNQLADAAKRHQYIMGHDDDLSDDHGDSPVPTRHQWFS